MGINNIQFPMLASGLDNTMSGQSINSPNDQQIMAMFQELMKQTQNMQAPQPMPPPHQASIPQALGSVLLGSLGSALNWQRPDLAQRPVDELLQQREELDRNIQGNLLQENDFAAKKEETLQNLALKRLDYAMARAKQDDNQTAMAAIQQAQADIKLQLAHLKAQQDLADIHAKGVEAQALKKIPNVNISHSTRDYTGLPGGAGGDGGGGGLHGQMTPVQMEKQASSEAMRLATNPMTKKVDPDLFQEYKNQFLANLQSRYNTVDVKPQQPTPKKAMDDLKAMGRKIANSGRYSTLTNPADKLTHMHADIDQLNITPDAKAWLKKYVALLSRGKQ